MNFFRRCVSRNNIQRRAGFTLIEIVVVIGLMVLIGTVTMASFESLYSFQSLDKDSDVVASYVEKARVQALNSKNYSEFGVRFASTSATLYQGTTYVSSTTNVTYNLSNKVQIYSINLSTHGTDVYFNKISGEPSATGTIVFRLINATSTTKTLTIYGTGLSEIQ